MQQVYDDELKPVHPMLSALRSGDTERIAEYSDLIVPNIDEKLLELTASIRPPAQASQMSFLEGNSQAQRLYNLLVGMDCDEDRIAPLVERVLDMHPDLSTSQMIAVALEWYESPSRSRRPQKAKSVPLKKWHTLNSEDLRFLFSQSGPDEMYEQLKQHSIIFDMEDWLRKSG
jgi:hypothetical protein